MGILGGITRPVADIAQKAAKAGQIKSVKVKLKFKPSKDAPKPDKKDDAS